MLFIYQNFTVKGGLRRHQRQTNCHVFHVAENRFKEFCASKLVEWKFSVKMLLVSLKMHKQLKIKHFDHETLMICALKEDEAYAKFRLHEITMVGAF